MSSSWPRAIRDPIHNIIRFGNNACDRLLWKLIDTTEFQRLRRIKQVGMSELVFPGATHTRFAHSVGVMHVARRMLDSLAEKGVSVEERTRIVVLCAALLHDTGHGPFSHAFEAVTKIKHEKYTNEVISDPDTEVNRRLREHDSTLPELVAQFLDESPDSSCPPFPPFFTHLVHSQLDADRLDYLLRDSQATGTHYGRFDLDWLLDHLSADTTKGCLFLDRKCVYAAEAYLFARHHMYQSVYFHKATRAAEVMLRILFRRYQDLLKEGEDVAEQQESWVPDVPPPVLRVFRAPGRITLTDYLELDDSLLTGFFKQCAVSEDPVLRRMGSGLKKRRLLKGTDVPEDARHEIAQFSEKAKAIVRQEGFEPDYFLVSDSPSDTPYKGDDPLGDSHPVQVYVEDNAGKKHELSQLAKPAAALREKHIRLRYYFPPDCRQQIEEVADQLWGSNK